MSVLSSPNGTQLAMCMGSLADMQPAGVQQAAQADFFLAGNSPERKPKNVPSAPELPWDQPRGLWGVV